MPAGALTTDPKYGPMVTCRQCELGGSGLVGGLPPPPPLEKMTGPANAQLNVQRGCHTGLKPLAANVKGNPTPPGAGTQACVRVPTLVNAPVWAFTAKDDNAPLESSVNTKLPCGSETNEIGP